MNQVAIPQLAQLARIEPHALRKVLVGNLGVGFPRAIGRVREVLLGQMFGFCKTNLSQR